MLKVTDCLAMSIAIYFSSTVYDTPRFSLDTPVRTLKTSIVQIMHISQTEITRDLLE